MQIITTLLRIAIFTAIFFLFSQIASATPPPVETTVNPDDISRIELNTSVSKQSGSYNQSYPIVVPPGRAGLTPNISLEYSSQASDYTSSVGYGWSINIPYIERINKTGLDKIFTANYFSSTVDGELVASGTTAYRPEIESGSFNTYSFTNGVWVSFDKKGTKYTYGSTSNSRLDNTASSSQVSVWYLSEILDTNGNKITFSYFKDAGQIYPETIGYSFVGTAPMYKIVFERASTTARINYKHTFPVETKYRISNINTYFGNNIIKNYKLDFTTHPGSKIPLLASIQETGLNEQFASTTLPKSTFTYSSTSVSLNWQNDPIWASSTPNDLSWKFQPYPAGQTSYYNRVSMMDMNGDALPDWVYGDQVHLNTGKGWTASSSWPALPTNDWTLDFRIVDVNGDMLPDVIQSKDVTYDPQFSGYTNTKTRTAYINNGNGTWATSSSVAANIPESLYTQFFVYPGGIQYYKTKVDFVDMNSDGFTDWVSNGIVYLNNSGNGWSTTTAWGGLPTSFEKNAKLADVNGDGLPDIVTSEQWLYAPIYNQGPYFYRSCQMNQGNGAWINDTECAANIPGDLFIRFQNYNTNPLVTYSYNDVYLTDLTGDGLADWYQNGTLYPNTGRGWSTSTAIGMPVSAYDISRHYRLEDINGDQLQDYVRAESTVWDQQFDPDIPTTVQREALIHQGKKAFLLSTSTNIFGGTTTISYKSTTAMVNNAIPNPHNPYALYTVNIVETDAGFGSKTKTTYSHSGGDLFTKPSDPLARRFAGYETVTATDNLSQTKTYYHQGNSNATTTNEVGDDYAKIGRAYKTDLFDLSNNLYRSTSNLFATSTPIIGSTYVRLATSTKRDFDGDADRKDSAITYAYNLTNGNVAQQVEWGEVTANADGTFTDTGTDKRTTSYTYASNPSLNIIGLPSSERLDDNLGAKVKESRYYYDTLALGSVNKGNLTRKEDWATTTIYVNTQSSYNSFGLKTQDLDPRGNATNYVYDSYNLYPATITNALNHSASYTYDYSSGKIKKMVDLNGFTHESTYDGLDRLLEKKVPILIDFFYKDTVVEKNTYTDIPGKVSVQNRRYLNQFDSYDQYMYFDGLGRKIQQRAEAENPNQYSVADVVYGSNGLVSKQSLPYFSIGAGRTNVTNQNNLYTNYSYDALGRRVGVGTVLGTTTLANDQWQETITDTLLNQTKNQYDAYGRLINVKQSLGTTTLTTTYLLSPHDQLTRVTDPAGNLRNFTYDGLGRRVRAEDLHASTDTTFGVWTYAYDAASNLATSSDPNAKVTVNTYDALNRITSENALSTAGIEATYSYDTCDGGIGRLCGKLNPQSNTLYDNYRPTGEVGTETKVINGWHYYTGRNYDFQGNPVEVFYPDGGSLVRNYYNGAGQLEKITLQGITGTTSTIIADIDYGPHGQITEQLFGNGVLTKRTYDENELYRLRNISTYSSSTTVIPNTGGPGEALQDIQSIVDSAIEQAIRQDMEGKATTTLEAIISSITESASISIANVSTSTQLIEDFATSTNQMVTNLSSSTVGTATNPASGDTSTIEFSSTTIDSYLGEQLSTSSQLLVPSTTVSWSEDKLLAKKFFKDKTSERLVNLKSSIPLSSSFVETPTEFNLVPKKTKERQLVVSADKLTPSVTLKEEVGDSGLSVSYGDNFAVASSSIYEEKFLRWENVDGNQEVNAYPLDPKPGMEFGGFEMEVVLSDKPSTNTFGFALTNDQNYQFYYQSPLTEEDVKYGRFMPDNVIGSYAVYNDGTKFMHIYRPKAHDAAGNEVWGTLVYTAGRLEVVIPQEFLDTAVYPVVVDPTFGNTTLGSGGSYFTYRDLFGIPGLGEFRTGGVFLATSSGNLTSITVALKSANISGVVSLEASIYDKDSAATNTHQLIGSVVRNGVQLNDWFSYYTFYFSAGSIEAGKEYILTIAGDADTLQCGVEYSGCSIVLAFDFVSFGNTDYTTSAISGSPEDPWFVEPTSNVQPSLLSIYASYESEATTTVLTPSGQVLQNLSYTYDSVGNITKIVDQGLGTGATTTFTYDSLYRLTRASTTQAQSNPYVETYAYNSLGNITNKSGVGAYLYQGNTGSLYSNPHAPTSINGVTYRYDRNGNLASTTAGNVNTWDYKNRLLASKNGSATTSYTYDVDGGRVTKTINGITTRYPSRNFEIAGATSTAHIYAGDQLVASIVTAGSEQPKAYFVHPDHLGSTNVMTDSTGTTTSRYTYYPFGVVRNSFGTTTFNQPNQYIGQDRDQEADLSYLNARYYDGTRGQFISQDPVFRAIGNPSEIQRLTKVDLNKVLMDPQALNSYNYARNNPIRYSDPEGLWFKEFATGQQSFSDFRVEVGQATQYMTDNSPAWNYAVSNPGKAGAVTGLVGGAAFLAGVPAAAAFSSSIVPVSGVGKVLVTNRLIEGSIYTYLAADSLSNLPNKLQNAANVKQGDLRSYGNFTGSFALDYGPGAFGEHADAIGNIVQLTQSLVSRLSDLVKQQKEQKNNKTDNKK